MLLRWLIARPYAQLAHLDEDFTSTLLVLVDSRARAARVYEVVPAAL